jgi:hypothetical protein
MNHAHPEKYFRCSTGVDPKLRRTKKFRHDGYKEAYICEMLNSNPYKGYAEANG